MKYGQVRVDVGGEMKTDIERLSDRSAEFLRLTRLVAEADTAIMVGGNEEIIEIWKSLSHMQKIAAIVMAERESIKRNASTNI